MSRLSLAFILVILLIGSAPASAGGPTIGSTASCAAVRQQAPILSRSLAARLSPASQQAALRLASTGTGSPTAQSWHDEAVMIYLRGNMPLAAWAALTAAMSGWQEVFVADAGTILLGSGNNEAGVQFLRCAYETGDRSFYVLEALATGYANLGQRGEARQMIDAIDNDLVGDPIIDIEQSFLDTGKPPPPSPPPTDELQRCFLMLDAHMRQIVASVRRRDTLLDEWLRTPNGHKLNIDNFAKLRASFANGVRAINAQASARSSTDAERVRFNGALMLCMDSYSQFTARDIDDALWNDSESVVFWADALAMSPEAYVDDTPHNFTPANLRRFGGGAINSISDFKQYSEDMTIVDNQYFPSSLTMGCKQWQAVHNRLAQAEEARYDEVAKQGFDAAATHLSRAIEAELADQRGFVARELTKLRRPVGSVPQIVMDASNRAQAQDVKELEQSLRGHADQFVRGERELQAFLQDDQRKINNQCAKILNPPNFDQLAQDQWQNVLAHFSSDFDSDVDCDLEFGDVQIEWKGNEEWKKLSLKWENVKYKLDLDSRQITTSGSWKWQVPGSESSELAEDGAEISVSPNVVEKDGQLVGVGVDTKIELGPMIDKGGVTLISDTNPMTGMKEPAVGFSGSAGLGVTLPGPTTSTSISCFPGKATAKVYPRGLLNDAVNYLLAASH